MLELLGIYALRITLFIEKTFFSGPLYTVENTRIFREHVSNTLEKHGFRLWLMVNDGLVKQKKFDQP